MNKRNALHDHIVKLSNSSRFESAKGEWKLVGASLEEVFHRCPCGRRIKEKCHLKNELNGSVTYVGNVCVDKFLGIDASGIFIGLKALIRKCNAPPNKALTEYAHSLGFIYDNEVGFIVKMRKLKSPTEKQLAWVKRINNRIIKRTKVNAKH